MGSLCQRMTEDLKLKNYAPATRSEYLRCARQFAAYHMRSPAEMGEREIRDFLLSLAFERKGVETLKMHVAALKFLYGTTLRRPEEIAALPWPKVLTSSNAHSVDARRGCPGISEIRGRGDGARSTSCRNPARRHWHGGCIERPACDTPRSSNDS